MSIQSNITNYTVKFLSGLANNDTIVPMIAKDTMQNSAIVYTYHKEGSEDDVRERAIEEFGTGAIWLLGIPIIKKLIDKFVYPKFGLDPNLDIRNITNENLRNKKIGYLKNSSNEALKKEKEIFQSLEDVNKVLKNKFNLKDTSKLTNLNLYKGFYYGKFIISTVLTGIALSKIIKYKQKTTEDRIKKDYNKNSASKVLVNFNLKKNIFSSNANQKNIPFKGAFSSYLYDPVKNTKLLDYLITTLRLKDARKGEHIEVGIKEAFQYLFIYHLAKPIQKGFEKIGQYYNLPIELDPNVIFDKNIKTKIKKANDTIGLNQIIYDVIDKSDTAIPMKNKNYLDRIQSIAKEDINNPLLDILEKNGVINILKDKNGNKTALSNLNYIDDEKFFSSCKAIQSLDKNIKNLSLIKAYKVFAVIANILIPVWATGVLQPKITIAVRKILNNGDNRNPAIIAKEREIENSNNKKISV